MNNNEKLAKIAVHKSLLKEYSNSEQERIVYMNDGTEFQIQIFNPYNYIIGVSFNFNNNLQSNSRLLVLRPGERVWLDRYLDNESRLLFSTYEVGNSEEIKKAIKDNGNVCIKFFKEQEKRDWGNNIYYINNPWTYYKFDNNLNKNFNTDYTVYCNASLESPKLSSVNYCQTLGLSSAATTAVSSSVSTCTSATYDAKDLIKTFTPNTSTENTRGLSLKKSKKIETGRIEEGSHSEQKFKNVNKDFEYLPFKTEYIKILPTSQKQITSNDLQKKYCYNCGRKLNQKYKFCPYCGAEQ